jgi:hypothetical protein
VIDYELFALSKKGSTMGSRSMAELFKVPHERRPKVLLKSHEAIVQLRIRRVTQQSTDGGGRHGNKEQKKNGTVRATDGMKMYFVSLV